MKEKLKYVFVTLGGGTILGFVAFFLLVLFAVLSPMFLDALLQAALFIPDKLGLVAHVTPDQIIEISSSGDQTFTLTWNGRYTIYSTSPTANYDIRLYSEATNQEIFTHGLPDLSQFTSEDLPSYEFHLPEIGVYRISITNLETDTLTIVPDVSNQNATVATFGGIIQVAGLIAGIRVIYFQLNKRKIEAETAVIDTKRQKWEAWLDKEGRKR